MRRVVLALVAAALLQAAAEAADIAGTVTIQTPIRKRATGPRHNPRYSAEAPPQREEDEVTNVVVYIEKVDTPFSVPAAHAVMAQKDKTFLPTVLPVVAGQTVDFPNNDPIYHNVYSDSKAANFELPQYAHGQSRSRLFDKPGVVELFCAIHSTMNAYVLVLQNPYFAQPDEKHGFTIKGVPAGHYIVTAWHPRVDPQSHPIDVPEKGTVKLDFTL